MTEDLRQLLIINQQLIDAAENLLNNNNWQIKFSASDLLQAIHNAKQTQKKIENEHQNRSN